MIHDTEKQLTIGRASMERVPKFLKDYCYALYLGAFGAYLFGFLGLFLFGAWGLWNDVCITRQKNTKKTKEERFLWSKILHKKLQKLAALQYVIKYVVWIGISLIWSYAYLYYSLADYIVLSLKDVMIKNIAPSSWKSQTEHVTLKMSYIIPFIDRYTIHFNYLLSKNFLVDGLAKSTFSFVWIICCLRSPSLFKYVDNIGNSVKKIISNQRMKIMLLSLSSLFFIYILSLVFIGVDGLFPSLLPRYAKDVGPLFAWTFIFIPVTWVSFSLMISMYKGTSLLGPS